jgi:hypothetical protein
LYPGYTGYYYFYNGFYYDQYGYYGFWQCSATDPSYPAATPLPPASNWDYSTAYTAAAQACSDANYGDVCSVGCNFYLYQ